MRNYNSQEGGTVRKDKHLADVTGGVARQSLVLRRDFQPMSKSPSLEIIQKFIFLNFTTHGWINGINS